MLNIRKCHKFMLGFVFFSLVLTAHSKLTVSLDHFRVLGEANFKFFLFNVYDARLLVDGRVYNNDSDVRSSWKSKRSIALEITYNRDASGEKIVETTINEIDRQAIADQLTLNQWEKMIEPIFPDIKKGDKIIARYDSEGKTEFSWNDRYIGQVSDARFSEAFFDIWLSSDSSDLDFTNQLFGQ